MSATTARTAGTADTVTAARPPRHAVELGVRALLIFAVVLVLPWIFTSDVRYYWLHAAGVSLHHLPYRDFLWEYPPVATVPLLLIPVAQGSYLHFLFIFAAAMALLEYACFLSVRRAWPEHAAQIDMWWHVLGLPLATIAWFRLDFVAVLPATLCLISLERGRRSVGALMVGIGAKLWPAVLVAGLVARRQWRQLRSVAIGCVVAGAAWYAFAPAGVRAFLRYRRGSGLQIESTFGSLVRLLGHRPVLVSASWVVDPGRWTWIEPIGLAAVGVAALVVATGTGPWRVRQSGLVEFLGACVLAVLLVSRLFSPQFVAWALPFVVVTAARGGEGSRRVAVAFGAAVGLTVLAMIEYRQLVLGSPLWALLVVARNGLLAATAWWMLRAAVERRRPARAGADPVLGTGGQ